MSKNQGLDKIIVVTSPLELRIKRIKARDLHRTEQQIAEIIKNQKSQEEFLAMADFEIKIMIRKCYCHRFWLFIRKFLLFLKFSLNSSI